MALTTLILLAGDLDRQYVDTFGQKEKSFRYYVEPTDDVNDRRETTSTTNRGWAWVEYGRLGTDGPEFFTTLLYAQAKRGVKSLTPVWVVCRGQARVRAGLQLVAGQATTPPPDLHDVPGVTVCSTGKEYTSLLATELFGFIETDRLATVLEMLKVLRTPHLGQKLDPDWFTEQMRAALPPIARTEIDELAEGWQQLEQLGRDRDSAAEARDAVKAYVRRTWRPWADAVLRRAADELIAANTGFDNVTRRVREAEAKLEKARDDLAAAESERDRLANGAASVKVAYEELLTSKAYGEATARTYRAQHLRSEAGRMREAAHARAQDASRSRGSLQRARAELAEADGVLANAVDDLADVVRRAAGEVRAAGLGDAAVLWADAADTDRLDAAVATRRAQLLRLRSLLGTAGKAQNARELAAHRATDAEASYTRREEVATVRTRELEQALQALSDLIEQWAGQLGDHAPDAELRGRWVTAVTEQAGRPRARGVLRERVRIEWLDPVTRPLTERAAVHDARVRQLRLDADAAEREADQRERDDDPVPSPPVGWTRRDRPAFPGPAGAPLWRLLDPVDGLDASVLDHVEAALAAAGLLDAWVTDDAMWLPERDGAESVISPATPLPRGGVTLGSVLRAAADAGPLATTVARALDTVAYAAAGEALHGAVAVAADGRWQTPTTSGVAAPAPHGAVQLGTAARAANRARLVATLRAEAARLRDDAGREAAMGAQLRAQVLTLQTAAAAAPDDAGVVQHALDAATAERERLSADLHRTTRRRELARAEEQADEANTAVLTFASEHALPSDGDALDGVSRAVDALAAATADLRLAARVHRDAERASAAAAERARLAAAENDLAQRAAEAAREEAEQALLRARQAEELLGSDDKLLLEREQQLRNDRDEVDRDLAEGRERCRRLGETVVRAEEQLASQDGERRRAEARRSAALTGWWVPVDAGLAAARGLPAAAGRTITHGRDQAQAARQQLHPSNWPDLPEATAEKTARVNDAWVRLTGGPLMELRAVLESSGGRSASILEAEETGGLPAVVVLVDASGVQVAPAEAVARLDQQVEKLAQLHDEKMHQVLVELLSSTFVEHLRDRLATVVALLEKVNEVLAAHPTGANRTVLRLRRVPAEGHRAGFKVLHMLERGFVDAPEVQEQIRTFLAERIREAQELGRASKEEWTEHLTTLLDYRRWFDVVTMFRVGDSDFRPLTRQVHGVDSGGGKVVTLLQPLLATLVALYDESPTAPRPLWLDEAFEGVDAANRATMLDLLVEFELDFLLAGPGQLVAAAQVPAAALWFVSRAPAPLPGVDLSLLLWAGRALAPVSIADLAAAVRPRHIASDGDDLFSVLDGDDSTG